MIIPRCLLPISAICPKKPGRYGLNAVRLSRTAPGLCRLETTDGRRLIRATWSDSAIQNEYPPIPALDHRTQVPGSHSIFASDWGALAKWKFPSTRSGFRAHKPVLHCFAVQETLTVDGHIRTGHTNLETAPTLDFPPCDSPWPNTDRVYVDRGTPAAPDWRFPPASFDLDLLCSLLDCLRKMHRLTEGPDRPLIRLIDGPDRHLIRLIGPDPAAPDSIGEGWFISTELNYTKLDCPITVHAIIMPRS